MIKVFEFVGVPSGDGDAFCWEVTPEEFAKVTEREPDLFDYADVDFEFEEDGSLNPTINSDMLRLYPSEFFERQDLHKYKVKIIVERLDENGSEDFTGTC